MNEGEPSTPPSGDAMRPPAVGGTLLDALDAALEAALDDDPLIEAFCQHDGLVGAVADLEFAVEVLRSELLRIERPDPSNEARGEQ